MIEKIAFQSSFSIVQTIQLEKYSKSGFCEISIVENCLQVILRIESDLMHIWLMDL